MIASSLLFFALGSLHTAYGPALPGLIARLDVTQDVAGLLPSSHFLGAVLGISGAMAMGRRLSFRHALAGFGLAVLLGGFGLTTSPSWPLMLIGAGLVGFGSGGLQVEVVGWLGGRFSTRARMALSVVHAFLSLGFVWGPMGVAISPAGRPFRLFFLTIVVGMLAVAVLIRSVGEETTDGLEGNRSFRLPQGVGLMALLFFFYVGLEIGIGTWEPTHLVARGGTESEAAKLTALFWGGFSLSRIAAGLLPRRVGHKAILLSGLGGAGAVLLSVYLFDMLVPAYAIAGVLLGPVFPAGLAWVSSRNALSTSSTGVLLLGSMSGGILFPPLMGFLISSNGTEVLPLIMAVIALVCCAILIIGMGATEDRSWARS